MIIKNNSGIALLLVMGVVAVLTYLLADLTFEVKLNKIKVYNQQEKAQARLNAESGIVFTLAKFRLYQEGRNRIEANANLKNAMPTADLESYIIEPFIYPIPVPKSAGLIQKSAAEEFSKKTIFNGEVSVSISKISGFLNPNGLRIIAPDNNKNNNSNFANDGEPTPPAPPINADSKKTDPPHVVLEKKLEETLTRLFKDKFDTDEEFHAKYANLDIARLIGELKFYVNNRGAYQEQDRPEIEAKFSQKKITPKFAPMTSIDELYLLPSWDDAIVDLVKDFLSVHDVNVIPINEIKMADLKILFPNISNIQAEEFFKYRDGDVDKKIKGKKFANADEFKNIITGQLHIASDTEYDDRIGVLKSAGIVIDTAGKLYKVISTGKMNNATVNIVAYIELPIKPSPKAKATKAPPKLPNGEPAATESDKDKKDPPTELMAPRVVEMRLE